jgi:hypothetical protein
MIAYTGSVEVGSGRVGLNVDTDNFAWVDMTSSRFVVIWRRPCPRRSTCTLRTSSG